MPEDFLFNIGIRSLNSTINEFNFNDILNKEFKLVDNNLLYSKEGNIFKENNINDINFDNAINLKITGILRIKENINCSLFDEGLGYINDLENYLINSNSNSEINNFVLNNLNINPFTGFEYSVQLDQNIEQVKNELFTKLGCNNNFYEIKIYPKSYSNKDSIKQYIDNYSEKITYIDMADLLGTALKSVINIISIVLIIFTSISLLVSAIMISIITYVSVLERIKEIGILRSIGASKKDIKKVFNSETCLIGFASGLFGVIICLLLSGGINNIVNNKLNIEKISKLNFFHIVLLIFLSITINLLSGLKPSKKASNVDPIIALKNE